MANILWTVITVLFIIWLVGFLFLHAGSLIHIVLVVAAVLLVFNLLTKGKATL